MTKEDAKEDIEERIKLEIEIRHLECQSVSNMTLAQLSGKLMRLLGLTAEHRCLSEKIKSLERLAPKES